LSTGKFQDVLRIAGQPKDKEELAADDIITDIDYNPNKKEYAYASADRMIYLRKFSPKGDEMPLQAVMQGHEEEVRQVNFLSKIYMKKNFFNNNIKINIDIKNKIFINTLY